MNLIRPSRLGGGRSDLDTREEFRRYGWRDLSARERVAIAMAHPPAFVPATAWQYSNTNYTLAGMVIEAVTGNRWEAEVRRRVLRPLGLHHTRTPDVSTALARPHPTLYRRFAADGP
jgi:D-alanyl-D-alanine carboxypeptidase